MHLFYQPLLKNEIFRLENGEHRHCSLVLRHSQGDEVHVTDGAGQFWSVEITDISKKYTAFMPLKKEFIAKRGFHKHLIVAPTKQLERMEWMVEKACELGIDEISFIQCQNSERPRLKLDRLEKKVVSALKQSKSAYKTILNPLTNFSRQIAVIDKSMVKIIAYVGESGDYLPSVISGEKPHTIVIGPEGDFTHEEVELAQKNGFRSVHLGRNVLRTETAAIFAASALSLLQE